MPKHCRDIRTRSSGKTIVLSIPGPRFLTDSNALRTPSDVSFATACYLDESRQSVIKVQAQAQVHVYVFIRYRTAFLLFYDGSPSRPPGCHYRATNRGSQATRRDPSSPINQIPI